MSRPSQFIGGHPDEVPLTKEEKNAIASLKRLATRWPRSLWLFSANGTLCVMRHDSLGNQPHVEHPHGGGVDPEYIVGSADIDNDGGDW